MKPGKAFDAFYFAGEGVPGGPVIVEGSSGSPRKWQEVGGYGLSGATLRFTGLGLATFDVIAQLITPEHWTAWEEYQRTILAPPKPGTYAKALAVFHPLLKLAEIGECVVEDIALPKQTQAGVWQVLISCKAFRKPKLTFATPDGAKAVQKPVDPVDALIAQKSQTIRARQLEDENFGRLTRAQAEALAANEALANRINRGEQ